MSEPLKPCPHCGEKTNLWSEEKVYCEICGARGPEESSGFAWNTRPSAWVSVEDRLPTIEDANLYREIIVAYGDTRSIVITLEEFLEDPNHWGFWHPWPSPKGEQCLNSD